MAHIQHCLRTTDDNGNFENDFLPDIDLSSTFLHASMYLGVVLDIILEFTDLWKTIHKQTLSKQRDIVKTEIDDTNVSTLVQASIENISIIGALQPILNNSSLPNPSSSHALPNFLPVNADCKAVANHIHAVLSLNVLQCLVVKEVLNHIIKNKKKLYVTRENHLLLYVRKEGGVGKSHMINALEMGFALLNRRNELVLSASTGCTAKGIGRSNVYRALKINTCKTKSLSTNISGIWTNCLLLIIDELSIIHFRLFVSMNK